MRLASSPELLPARQADARTHRRFAVPCGDGGAVGGREPEDLRELQGHKRNRRKDYCIARVLAGLTDLGVFRECGWRVRWPAAGERRYRPARIAKPCFHKPEGVRKRLEACS